MGKTISDFLVTVNIHHRDEHIRHDWKNLRQRHMKESCELQYSNDRIWWMLTEMLMSNK